MFADTGVPLLFQSVYALGCKKANLVIKVVGGATMHDTNGVFDIGRRNYNMLRKLFWKNSVLIEAEDVGGEKSVRLTPPWARGPHFVGPNMGSRRSTST